jgi:diaminopimelate decarboxylase
LVFAGVRLSRLADSAGRTPFYAYSRSAMAERIATLRRHLPSGVHVHYAMKANPMPAVVAHMARLVDGIDVASQREMRIALDAGMAAEHISFAGPGKSSAELGSAIAAGIGINLESDAELSRVAAIAGERGYRARVAVRVNPDFELRASGMKMGGGAKQFGVDAEQVPALLQRMRDLPVEFLGFHIFSGSQNLRAAAITEAQEKTVALAIRLAEYAPAPVRLLNIGGGFGIPYFPGDEPLDIAAVGAAMTAIAASARNALPQASITVELGRYLVGEAGIYVCRVIERKLSRGQVFLVTDGGLHHHLAASGNFGQILRKNYPVVIGDKLSQSTHAGASVVGPLCTPLDLLGDRMELAHAEAGDLVVLFQSGAYGYSASPHGFLSHPPPLELLV